MSAGILVGRGRPAREHRPETGSRPRDRTPRPVRSPGRTGRGPLRSLPSTTRCLPRDRRAADIRRPASPAARTARDLPAARRPDAAPRASRSSMRRTRSALESIRPPVRSIARRRSSWPTRLSRFMTADAGDCPSTSSSLHTTVTAIITANAMRGARTRCQAAARPGQPAALDLADSEDSAIAMAHSQTAALDEEQAARLLTLHAREIRWKRVREIRRPARPLRPQRVDVAAIEVREPSPIDSRQQRRQAGRHRESAREHDPDTSRAERRPRRRRSE